MEMSLDILVLSYNRQEEIAAMTTKPIKEFAVPSKTSVRKAGKILCKENPTAEEFEGALDVLSQWRSLYSYPINDFQNFLRRRLKKDGYANAIVAQRIKRMPSIIGKLIRFPSMGLERMQDIGGIRVVLDKLPDVYRFHESLLLSKKHQAVLPPDDYIQTPKDDGYRSLHQVFKYSGKSHHELDGLRMELQIRTRIQHEWATAVETLGIIEKSSFKTGEGSEDFRTFFKLSSALFSIEEKSTVIGVYSHLPEKEIAGKLLDIERRLRVLTKLQGIAFTGKQIETASKQTDEYHLMVLDAARRLVSITPYSKKQWETVIDDYRTKEQKTKDNPDISIVLVSAGDFKAIKKAYPNYFLDTNNFIRRLKHILKRNLK